MKRVKIVLFLGALACLAASCSGGSPRSERLLENGWTFAKGDHNGAETAAFDDSGWERVTVPHDWAIYGPFDRANDLQDVTVTQNFEKRASVKTGRTGGLPYVGVGWYRTNINVEGFDPASKRVTLLFDGAMSEAGIFVNGREACFWPNGYNAFHVDVTELINPNGADNLLAVRLENRPQSSRWYSGAGLYRNVKLIVTDKAHIPVWGAYITTPEVSASSADVKLITRIEGVGDSNRLMLQTIFKDPSGKVVAKDTWKGSGGEAEQNVTIRRPALWSPESPSLYTAVSTLSVDGRVSDTYTTAFGIRSVEFSPEKGFVLNGVPRKFQGVCLHHDLGPLGAAVNVAAIQRQLRIIKDMGCDAVRTAHNMPATELVELCDRMGLMVMVEAFDEWDVAKCDNGYHRFFNDWAEKDIVNMVRHFRNNPSVVMWSIGNEVPTQHSPDGRRTAGWLQSICHREDPTRPVTCGMDQVLAVLDNGFAEAIDIPGLNYRTHLYGLAHEKLPGKLILGCETASTVSSRGVYKFPVEQRAGATYPDHQSSSYDVEHCWWSNIPDEDFALADDHDWTIGQFVWTGFDYLGEPSPYDTDAWPSHSSLFGIVDLAGLPKDRFWLYRSLWNETSPTLHVLPHWTWPGREGEVTPVFVYTSYPEAELFINGRSQGRRKFSRDGGLMERYRLMWMDTVYEPGELKVVAYDASGAIAGQTSMKTAGEPSRIVLTADRTGLTADGKDLVFIRVDAVDADGVLCPSYNGEISFNVSGAGSFRAAANGDPTCVELFHLPAMHAFNGSLTSVVQAGMEKGTISFTASSPGLDSATIRIPVKKVDRSAQ